MGEKRYREQEKEMRSEGGEEEGVGKRALEEHKVHMELGKKKEKKNTIHRSASPLLFF